MGCAEAARSRVRGPPTCHRDRLSPRERWEGRLPSLQSQSLWVRQGRAQDRKQSRQLVPQGSARQARGQSHRRAGEPGQAGVTGGRRGGGGVSITSQSASNNPAVPGPRGEAEGALPSPRPSTSGLCDGITAPGSRLKGLQGDSGPTQNNIRNSMACNLRDSPYYHFGLAVTRPPSRKRPVTQAGPSAGHLATFGGEAPYLPRPRLALKLHH